MSIQENQRSKRRPVIAFIGRTNVGKSTIFNFLVGRRKSIVNEEPGATRDRIYADVSYGGYDYVLVDTGGLEPHCNETLQAAIERNTHTALAQADLVVMVVDSQAGILPQDREIANILRRAKKPRIVVANKSDSPKLEQASQVFFELGLANVALTSAAQGVGLVSLMEEINELLGEKLLCPSAPQAESIPDVLCLALIGRPNVGKSSLVNKLVGDERCLVSDMPGTTMDAIDLDLDYAGKSFRLIDTAGIRRKRSIGGGFEKQAVARSLNAIDRSQVTLLMIDPLEGLTEQDMKLAAFSHDKGKGCVVVVNKWDLAKEKGMKTGDFAENLREMMPFLAYAPIRFVSAKTGTRVFDILDTASEVALEYFKRVSTSKVNAWLADAIDKHEPPISRGRRIKLYFASQVSSGPPTFLFSCNESKGIHFSYQRYLSNQIRETFGFKGAPVRLVFRPKSVRSSA